MKRPAKAGSKNAVRKPRPPLAKPRPPLAKPKPRVTGRADPGADAYQGIYRVVCAIPRGRVATYGQIAELSHARGGARQVGYALAALHDDRIPWQRVINARGDISARSEPMAEAEQRKLLIGEGIAFDHRGRISLARFRWLPGS